MVTRRASCSSAGSASIVHSAPPTDRPPRSSISTRWPSTSPTSKTTASPKTSSGPGLRAASSKLPRGCSADPAYEETKRMTERTSVGTVEDLHASATKITGITDFGDPGYQEGLQVLLDSFAHDADLTPLGSRVF